MPCLARDGKPAKLSMIDCRSSFRLWCVISRHTNLAVMLMAPPDFNYWSGFLGMAQFHKDFGVWDSALGEWTIPSTWQSIATGTPQAALAVGCVISGSIGNKVGRVKALWVAAGIAIVGILLQATSFHSYWQFTVGRVVNSVSMGIICKCDSQRCSEHKHERLTTE